MMTKIPTFATLTETQRELLPTDEEVKFFQEHGYYHSRTVFTGDEIEQALAGSERFYAGEVDTPPVMFPHTWYPTGEYGPGLRKHDYASLLNRELDGLARHPLVGAIAARLAGTSEIRRWHDQLLYKPPDRADVPANVGWHTDRGYWKTCSSAAMLTAWIPFHDCDEAMGTITMIDGSLHWPDNTAGLNFFSNDLDGLEQRFQTGGRPVVKVPMNLKRGQISFHHCLTIHGSGPNRSQQPRRSLALHLQDASNHWQENHHADGSLARHGNDALCRRRNGVPDYADPDICPALYREA